MDKIAILTSGGDAPGMNAAIRAVVRRGIFSKKEIIGISFGYQGLIGNNFHKLKTSNVGDIIHRGGTILSSSRCNKFKTVEGQKIAAQNLESAGIDGLIIIGGDGSLKGAKKLHDLGIAVIGVPATIDNDIPHTELTIGFDTAVNTVIQAIDKIRDTATSHERIFVIEVMGRDNGNIALWSGTAGGAESILIPESKQNLDDVITKLINGIKRGKKHNIIVVAEGAGPASEISRIIKEKAGLENRVTVLGHVQRGGSPTAKDRILGSTMGAKAIDKLIEGKRGEVVINKNGKITTNSLDKIITGQKTFAKELYKLNASLSI